MTTLLKYIKRIYWFIINKNPMDYSNITSYRIRCKVELTNRRCDIYRQRLCMIPYRIKE